MRKMTDEQLIQLVEGLAAESAKTTEEFREIAKQSRKTDEQFRKTDEQFRKTDEQLRRFGGFMKNDGKVVEEYFFSGLDKTNKLHGEDYDYFSQGDKYSMKRGKEQEFDIIGFNGNKITALEVKKIVHKNDVEKLVEKQLPFLKEFMSKNIDYRTHKIYGGIAGFKINKDAEEYAREKGLIILTKHGNQIEELTKDCEIIALD